MAPSFCIELGESEQEMLLEIARKSIISGLPGNIEMQLDNENMAGSLISRFGAFVTLTKAGALRGCIGSLESSSPLTQTVTRAAHNSAFSDARFPQLDESELDKIRIEISVLSEPVPIEIIDRADLLAKLVPKLDGLLLEDGRYRSVFLPKVWDKISGPNEFLEHLLAKAGLPTDHWSRTICFKRFSAFSFGE